jgi:hypothetical protein
LRLFFTTVEETRWEFGELRPDHAGDNAVLRREYLVINRSGEWWITLDGDRRGPHASRQEAIASAILAAKLEARTGTPARVSVDEPDDGVPVVYDSEDG